MFFQTKSRIFAVSFSGNLNHPQFKLSAVRKGAVEMSSWIPPWQLPQWEQRICEARSFPAFLHRWDKSWSCCRWKLTRTYCLVFTTMYEGLSSFDFFSTLYWNCPKNHWCCDIVYGSIYFIWAFHGQDGEYIQSFISSWLICRSSAVSWGKSGTYGALHHPGDTSEKV